MLSSSKPEKNESRLAARIDVLAERVDTLASTLATTASAMARKDGEIASLRRDLLARDEAVQALAVQARVASETPVGGAAVDANELRSLKNAVAALSKERADGGSSTRVGDLAADVHALAQRVDELSTTPPDVGTETTERLDALAAELASLRAESERRASEADRPSEELRTMLTTLGSQVEALATLRAGASDDHLDERFADSDERSADLSERLESLASTVVKATSSLADKERELVSLHEHFTESGARIESIVEDIRDALAALPEPGSVAAGDLAPQIDRIAARLDRIEAADHDAAEASERSVRELNERSDRVEQRVTAVATEVARAKALWPVALRSLEARLDDVISHARRPEHALAEAPTDPDTDEPSADDDLLAGLRDSLQAMESVAAEMARASDVLTPPHDPVSADEAVAVGGATIVPLRAPDP